MTGSIKIERQGDQVFLRLENSGAKNALTTRMWEQIGQACAELAGTGVRTLILASAVPGVFSAGADLADVEGARADHQTFEAIVTHAHQSLLQFPAPVIAIIDGPCIGGGLALALDADFRIATHRSTFGIPAARLGLAYPALETSNLVATVGMRVARRLLLMAENFDATEALAVGLVDEVVPGELLDETVGNWTRRLLSLAPLAHRANRRGILASAMPTAINTDPFLREACWDSRDLKEGISAFRERRRPSFDNR